MAIWDDYNWDIWDGKGLPKEKDIKDFHKISLCTTCMDRIHDLAITLPKNVEDNKDYENLEFVIVDYGGSDNLDKFILNRFPEEIESGRIVYYRVHDVKHYSMAHSRNIGFKLATGDTVHNLDADNFTNKGFATYLNRMAQMRPEKASFAKGKRGLHGRIGFWKREFMTLGGYDESFEGYGADDMDLLARSMLMGHQLLWWGGQFCDRLKTSGDKKIENMKVKNWRKTEDANKELMHKNLQEKNIVANKDIHWGKAKVTKNNKEDLEI